MVFVVLECTNLYLHPPIIYVIVLTRKGTTRFIPFRRSLYERCSIYIFSVCTLLYSYIHHKFINIYKNLNLVCSLELLLWLFLNLPWSPQLKLEGSTWIHFQKCRRRGQFLPRPSLAARVVMDLRVQHVRLGPIVLTDLFHCQNREWNATIVADDPALGQILFAIQNYPISCWIVAFGWSRTIELSIIASSELSSSLQTMTHFLGHLSADFPRSMFFASLRM